MTGSPLSIIEEWRRKSSEFSSQSTDALFSLATKTFETMIVVFEDNNDHIFKAIADLDCERLLALQYENNDVNSLRRVLFGIIESIEHCFTEMVHWRRQNDELSHFQLKYEPLDEVFDDRQIVGIGSEEDQGAVMLTDKMEPKIEIFDDQMMDDEIFNSMEDDIINEDMEPYEPIGHAAENTETHGANNEGKTSEIISKSSKSTKHKNGKAVVKKMQMKPMKKMNRKKRKSSKKGPSLMNNSKRPVRRNSTELECFECDFRTFSVTGWRFHLKVKHFTTPLQAGLALLCECGHASWTEYHSYECDIANFTVIRKDGGPMGRKENKKMTEDGIMNAMEDDIVNGEMEPYEPIESTKPMDDNTVVKKMLFKPVEKRNTKIVSDKIDRARKSNEEDPSLLDNSKSQVMRSSTELECFECDFRTFSVGSWRTHLRVKHFTTPVQSGLALLCECGHESRNESHSYECDIGNFTVIRKDGGPVARNENKKMKVNEVTNSMQDGIADGEMNKERDTLHEQICDPDVAANELSLMEEEMPEDNQIVSDKIHQKRKSNEEDSSLLNNSMSQVRRSSTELECFECDFRTFSPSQWRFHLRVKHFTTPVQAGLALLCECGHESRNESHSYECDIGNFTVIRKNNEPTRRKEDKKMKLNEVMDSMQDDIANGEMETQDSSETRAKKIGRRSSRIVSKPERFEDYDNNNELVRKMQADAEKNEINKCQKVVRRSDKELECPNCEYRTFSVCAWCNHLSSKHSTTPILSGVYLLCDCGHESQSEWHSRECDIGNFTVIRKNDRPSDCLDESKIMGNESLLSHTDDKPIEEPTEDIEESEAIVTKTEEIPSITISQPSESPNHGDITNDNHVVMKKQLEPEKSNENNPPPAVIHDHNRKTSYDEPSRSDTTKCSTTKLSDTELECFQCDFRTFSAWQWRTHLRIKHFTTPVQSGLYLLCECGNESQSYWHSYECDIANFTVIRKNDDSSRRSNDEKAMGNESLNPIEDDMINKEVEKDEPIETTTERM